MIRYNDARLRNVWLENGYREARTAYGKGLVIVRGEENKTAVSRDMHR